MIDPQENTVITVLLLLWVMGRMGYLPLCSGHTPSSVIRVAGIEPWLARCKAHTLSVVLAHWPLITLSLSQNRCFGNKQTKKRANILRRGNNIHVHSQMNMTFVKTTVIKFGIQFT